MRIRMFQYKYTDEKNSEEAARKYVYQNKHID